MINNFINAILVKNITLFRLAISKSDMLDDELKTEIAKNLPKIPCVFISSLAQQGIVELKDLIWKHLNYD